MAGEFKEDFFDGPVVKWLSVFIVDRLDAELIKPIGIIVFASELVLLGIVPVKMGIGCSLWHFVSIGSRPGLNETPLGQSRVLNEVGRGLSC